MLHWCWWQVVVNGFSRQHHDFTSRDRWERIPRSLPGSGWVPGIGPMSSVPNDLWSPANSKKLAWTLAWDSILIRKNMIFRNRRSFVLQLLSLKTLFQRRKFTNHIKKASCSRSWIWIWSWYKPFRHLSSSTGCSIFVIIVAPNKI